MEELCKSSEVHKPEAVVVECYKFVEAECRMFVLYSLDESVQLEYKYTLSLDWRRIVSVLTRSSRWRHLIWVVCIRTSDYDGQAKTQQFGRHHRLKRSAFRFGMCKPKIHNQLIVYELNRLRKNKHVPYRYRRVRTLHLIKINQRVLLRTITQSK
jgi:hypothetical protein